jgi:hypothetical protein
MQELFVTSDFIIETNISSFICELEKISLKEFINDLCSDNSFTTESFGTKKNINPARVKPRIDVYEITPRPKT